MTLKAKFILAMVLILSVSYGLLILYTSHLQNRLIIGQAVQQARMLFRQRVLTRQWIADHQGLFLVPDRNYPAQCLLDKPVITTDTGLTLVKRNPAMAPREFSDRALRSGFPWSRVTSL